MSHIIPRMSPIGAVQESCPDAFLSQPSMTQPAEVMRGNIREHHACLSNKPTHACCCPSLSSSRTWRLWLTGMILIKYALTMISHVTSRQSKPMRDHNCQLFNQGQTENDNPSSPSLLDFDPFANTVVFASRYFLCTKWKASRSYWFCSPHPSLSKMH